MKTSAFKDFLKQQENYYLFYIILLFAYVSYYLVQWPIFAGDTDLWYHLNGGRYILQHGGAIPRDSSFFSFMTPPREWVDYYWLFQVLVYKIYTFSGYYGLIFLRTIIFLATIFIIYLILNRGIKNKPDLYTILLFSLYMLILLPRFHLIRPHIFSYLFIALFIFIIELKPKYLFLLPFIAVSWTNLHGIEYPVMLLIALSYMAEFIFSHIISRTHINKNDLFFVVPLILSISAVFCTPHGAQLTWVPFIPTGFASLYINEIAHIKPEELFTFQIVKMTFAYGTVFNILFFVSCIAAITSLFNWNRKIGRFLIFAGGIVLLMKASRFRYECALLSLPILKDVLSEMCREFQFRRNIFRPVGAVAVIIAMLITVLTLKNSSIDLPKYPFSHRNLPEGICTFLNKITEAKGTVFNHPNHGGYLQWMLYPKYKIFMDMEIPFLFINEDMFVVNNAFSTETGLRGIVEKYHPSFIIAPIWNNKFKGLIAKYPEYRIVFFDETSILYVDKKQSPKIADEYELKEIDAYSIININISSIMSEKRDERVLKELSRLNNIYSGCILTNQLMAHLYIKKKDYAKSILYSENIIKNYPESTIGYKLRADALKDMGKYENAISEYKKAIDRTVNKVEIYREIGAIYMKQQKYAKAYDTLKMITDPFSSATDYITMYDVCLAAILSGNQRDAEILFQYANALVPPENKEWIAKFIKLAEMIKQRGG